MKRTRRRCKIRRKRTTTRKQRGGKRKDLQRDINDAIRYGKEKVYGDPDYDPSNEEDYEVEEYVEEDERPEYDSELELSNDENELSFGNDSNDDNESSFGTDSNYENESSFGNDSNDDESNGYESDGNGWNEYNNFVEIPRWKKNLTKDARENLDQLTGVIYNHTYNYGNDKIEQLIDQEAFVDYLREKYRRDYLTMLDDLDSIYYEFKDFKEMQYQGGKRRKCRGKKRVTRRRGRNGKRRGTRRR
jgi:hypothetical protein